MKDETLKKEVRGEVYQIDDMIVDTHWEVRWRGAHQSNSGILYFEGYCHRCHKLYCNGHYLSREEFFEMFSISEDMIMDGAGNPLYIDEDIQETSEMV